MVISEEMRVWLYPLGMISTIAFTLRFMIQWLQSEAAHRSIVTRPFWFMSVAGNIALGIHSLIQGQYAICLVQSVNGVIACRNLNLMKHTKFQWRFRTVVILLAIAFMVPTLLFYLLSNGEWFRVPVHSFQSGSGHIPLAWHLLGSLGVILFASRFWVQWIQSERAHRSTLESPFWWLSLTGAILSILYFALIQDYINLVGPLFGLIPYCRNLILINSDSKEPSTGESRLQQRS